jgi:hypothetical protein
VIWALRKKIEKRANHEGHGSGEPAAETGEAREEEMKKYRRSDTNAGKRTERRAEGKAG